MKRPLAALITAALATTLALTGTAGTADANVPGEVSAIWNTSPNGLGLGVDHIHDGVYALGPFDALLPSGHRTDVDYAWGRAEAYMQTEPGYCYSMARRDINRPDLPFTAYGVFGPYNSSITYITTDGWLWKVNRWRQGDPAGTCP